MLSPRQRSTHLQVVGASGTGKSKLLEHMLRQDIRSGHGVVLIDPHGTLYDDIVKWCARGQLERFRRIHLVNPNEDAWAVGFDPLRRDYGDDLSRRVDTMVHACAQVWSEDSSRTPTLKKCLRAVFYALGAHDLTLNEAITLITANDVDGIRRYLTANLGDEQFSRIWADINAWRKDRFSEEFNSTNNRMMEFLTAPRVARIFGVKAGALDLRAAMNERHIILVNLRPKNISRDNARLIGTLFVSELLHTAFTRDTKDALQSPCYLYIDECYRFLTTDIEDALDEARKLGLHLTLSHQRLGQLREYGEGIYNGVMQGTRTKCVFGGLEDDDAAIMARQIFRAEFSVDRPKKVLNKPVVIDEVPVWLHSESKSVVESWQEGRSIGMATGASAAMSQYHTGPDGTPAEGYTEMTGTSAVDTSGTFSAEGVAIGRTAGRHQTFKAIRQDMPTATYTIDELVHKAVVRLRELPMRAMIFKTPQQKSRQANVPVIEDTIAGDAFAGRFVTRAHEASVYARPAGAVATEIKERRELLRRSARTKQKPPAEDPDGYFE